MTHKLFFHRKKLDALERANKDQKHQLSSLRVVVEKQEANLAEKEKLNAELEDKLGQHAAMISMIQNITTGKKKWKLNGNWNEICFIQFMSDLE